MDPAAVSPARDQEAPSPPQREPGQLVANRFRIEQKLAEGGMGVVFVVTDERDGRRLALKQQRFLPDASAGLLAAQFEREYHTLSQLHHPCIIEVYDYGLDDAGAYYTMELLEGQDLRGRGQLAWREACPILRDVASSLAILHSRRLLHRDVTARNVFCTHTGRSKLIDFGAMMTMGVAKHIVGTPPFVPPEALQQQALDGRADLYSLGVLAYWLLTGSYPYPARSFGELKQRFETPPPSMRHHIPDLPQALDELVMGLLQLERSARPSTAGEVMERLSGIAGLPPEARADVGKAYLVTPMLVGQAEVTERLRVDLLSARQSQGTTVLIEGAPGSGRSRALDACILKAKLRGATVLRADAGGGSGVAYAVIGSIASQLIKDLPIDALQAARPQRDVLGHVIPELRARATLEPAETRPAPARRQIQAALRDWFIALSRDKHVVIAVDDVDRIDEPSAAVLGALAHGARRRKLNLIVTATTDHAPTAALALLHSDAHIVTLRPFSVADTERLLRAVFGDVPHVSALTERFHAVAAGNPSATMMLAEHLVERGIARYETGSWSLPEHLLTEHLPTSATAALHARIEALPLDARELAEVVALSDPEAIPLESYPKLTAHGDHGRAYHALEALVTAGVLRPQGDRYRFALAPLAESLERAMSPEQKRVLHERLAGALDGSLATLHVARHLLLGGHERDAIARVLALYNSMSQFTRQETELLEAATAAAARLRVDLEQQLELKTLLIHAAASAGQLELFRAHFESLRLHLERDSGLIDYRELPNELSDEARSAEAVRRAEERYRSSPKAERGLRPGELERTIPRVCAACCTMAAVSQDVDLIEQIPRLEPLLSHFPRLAAIQAVVDIQRDMQRGRAKLALERSRQLIYLLEQRTDTRIETALANALRFSQLYLLGLFAATNGHAEARQLVSELEDVPGHRVNAWRVRMVYDLMHGNMDSAAECRRRSELLNLQDGGNLVFPGTTARVELLAHMYADDVVGVKRAMETITELATRYAGWAPTLAIARCHYRRLQGDPAEGLRELEPALAIKAGRHIDWWLVAYSHLKVLCDLDRAAEAAQLGKGYRKVWADAQLSSLDFGLAQVTAEALTRSGQIDQAKRMIDDYIETHVQAGTQGLRLGLAYETRARIAIALHDDAGVQQFTRRCAQQYKGGRHLSLLNRYARLLREADAEGIALSTGLRFGADIQAGTAQTQTAHTVHSRLLGCVGSAERCEAGLRVLLDASGAESGYLFGLRRNHLVMLAPEGASGAPPQGIVEWLEGYVRDQLAEEPSTTQNSHVDDLLGPVRFTDAAGRHYEPELLSSAKRGKLLVGGVAVLHYSSARRVALRREVLEALTDVLIADSIVDPLSL